jgi:hypothetical protein
MYRCRVVGILALLLLLGSSLPDEVRSQCILANPSFEIGDPGSAVFGGWNQFGVVGSSSVASHGAVAARVSGPNLGDWGVSGFWQRQDSEPGEQWEVTAQVLHPSAHPLTGQSLAIVNVEWRDAAGSLIDFESYTAADASTPTDEYQEFSATSSPAPAGTAAIHLLLGVLQSPDDPVPDVLYDQVTCFSLQSPTMDEQQWGDFPGGRVVDFAGRTWRVKGPGYYGPGPNLFSDSVDCIWVDGDDRLHLTIQNLDGQWYSTEVALEEALGYGDYVFTTQGRLDLFDPHVVLGLFIWQYGPCWDPAYLWWNPYNEIDVEISRWGVPGNDVAQFVAQPYDYPGNLERFDVVFAEDELTSYAFRWLPDRVEFRSWHGGPEDELPANLIHTWTYTGPHIPRPEQPRVHLNMWQFDGPPAENQEVVIADFTFVPEGVQVPVIDHPGMTAPGARLFAAHPNPFNPVSTIGYSLETGSVAEIVVYDVTGRRIRTLVSGFVPAGQHETTWDGRDDTGTPVASGVYLYQLRAGDVAETRRMTLVK